MLSSQRIAARVIRVRSIPPPTRSPNIYISRFRSSPGLIANFRSFSAATTPNLTFFEPPPRSRFRRFISVCVIGIVFTTVGFVSAIIPMAPAIDGLINPPTDLETLDMFQPQDRVTDEIESFLKDNPEAIALSANPDFIASRPTMKIPETARIHNFTAGTLSGPGKLWVPPLVFLEKGGKSTVIMYYIGSNLCGHQGIVHGGLLATLLDEGMARCCFSALPNKVGMTANLNVNFRKPMPADSYVVLRAVTTKVEGRKAWVEGRLESLTPEGETPTVYAEASALFVEPRQAAAMTMLNPVVGA